MEIRKKTIIPLTAVILAGGKSLRMGSDKASLPMGHTSLLERQAQLVRKAGASSVLISLAHAREGLPFPVVLDRRRNCGPLAGLEAALAVCPTPLLLVLAVDLPEMSFEFLDTLVRHCSPTLGRIPTWGDQMEPLAAVYPTCLFNLVEQHLNSGRLAMRDLAEAGRIAGMLAPFPVAPSEQYLFTNWNHPEDWTEIG
ncbi:MAG: molybdenum cofactor guanylyltransferase [Pedosphaera sp.]|nr:molybdenum cofactor guanylyltransferase [Pedosphaera sp.]